MDVLTVDFTAKNAAQIFTDSLKYTGFAVLKNHPIDKNLVDKTYEEWQYFFADPEKEKMDYLYNKDTQEGFFPMSVAEVAQGYTAKDIKEFYHVYPWGKMPKNIGTSTMQLYYQLSNVAATLLNWVEQCTPPEISQKFSMPLSEMIKDSPRTLFRILHYPPLPETIEPGAIRAAAHLDINMLTLLPAATDGGLQVRDAENRWHDVPCDFGTLAVNTAEMLQLCTENYYKATAHRVVNPIGEAAKRSRLSMPLFLHCRSEVQLTPTLTAEQAWRKRMEEVGHS